ncbi:hypothetical protein LU674_013065 [Pseudomonas alloputida]|uniref:DUF3149 domain-containing protein n=1 Tax=Pseudomonas alloputida TaxID=1940621 RepID=A0AAW7HIR6_9PSED|nr:hypothetical protein [Pseudomonas alloputida]MDM3882099.1 hypothetical protein [Pseudomonas alloputida]MDM3953245.1 hypothetical protein [Pseudomonas alloputida]WJR15144.1 hypothetical protein LU682_018340 [Pseudomonas alloputida]WJR59939.1 hypothetical protein LU693_018270 [Pseudomonas alloputida]
MNWTPLDTAQLLLLGMVMLGAYCIVRGMVIAAKRKREEGGPCN